MRASWIPAHFHFFLNAHMLSFAGTSEGEKREGVVPYFLFNVQGSAFYSRHGGLWGFHWCITVTVADDHSTEEGEKRSTKTT